MMTNNEDKEELYSTDYDLLYPKFNSVYLNCCRNCSNNPSNGGSGICGCVLPYMTDTGDYPSWQLK